MIRQDQRQGQNTSAATLALFPCRIEWAWSLLLIVSGCATPPPTVIPIDDSRVSLLIIADRKDVYNFCYHKGGHNDQGGYYGQDAKFGGCFKPEDKIIVVNRDCDLPSIVQHELCHAISGLSQKDCDDNNPVNCGGSPFPYSDLEASIKARR